MRDHGYARYKLDSCRCQVCTQANRDYSRERARRQAPPYVGAARARTHVRELMAAGVGLKTIAARSKVSHGTLSKLIYGTPTRPPSRRIRPATESALLAVTPADRAGGATVDATRTWEIIDQLLAKGWTKGAIARAIGQGGPGLQLSRGLVTQRNAAAVAALADQPVPPRRTRYGVVEVDTPVEQAEEAPPTNPALNEIEHLMAPEEGDTAWMARGACRTTKVPTWVFFPGRGDQETTEAALAVCATCSVADACLDYALLNGENDGVWGGKTAKQRRHLVGRRRALQQAKEAA
jgi:hypothetical protein